MKQFMEAMILQNKVLRKLNPREVTIFNVKGNFGHYQVKLWPMDPKEHSRPIEINGEIHHLFVTKDKVGPLPKHDEVLRNMRGTVIMKDISIHLFDEKGDGHAVKIERIESDGAHAKKRINLAGDEGEKIIHEMEATGRLANETYHIVQEDILKSMKG